MIEVKLSDAERAIARAGVTPDTFTGPGPMGAEAIIVEVSDGVSDLLIKHRYRDGSMVVMYHGNFFILSPDDPVSIMGYADWLSMIDIAARLAESAAIDAMLRAI